MGFGGGRGDFGRWWHVWTAAGMDAGETAAGVVKAGAASRQSLALSPLASPAPLPAYTALSRRNDALTSI